MSKKAYTIGMPFIKKLFITLIYTSVVIALAAGYASFFVLLLTYDKPVAACVSLFVTCFISVFLVIFNAISKEK